MGVADIIPGVSGGTLALILGIYERFIGALSSIGWGLVRAIFGREFWRRAQATRATTPSAPTPPTCCSSPSSSPAS
jgi:hypothetical protein